MKKTLSIVFFILALFFKAEASKLTKAYDALSIYDYFKAKRLFYATVKKKPFEASYGLANIYYRSDNPFSNVDSAAKYISLCLFSFKDSCSYGNYHLNKYTIDSLAEQIAVKGFYKYNHSNSTIASIQAFLQNFYFANTKLKEECYLSRDKIAFQQLSRSLSSDSVKIFLETYPESSLYTEALNVFYNYQFKENVPSNKDYLLKNFIHQFPNNPNIIIAEDSLFELIKQAHQPDSLYSYIKNYSSNKTKNEAWKMLYGISVKGYNQNELSNFKLKYPDYPYNDEIEKEIKLAQKTLIPLKDNNELYGYIDHEGKWAIAPKYDDAFEFSEGYAVVYKADSCFFINKEDSKVSAEFFDEAESYINGIAIVKRNNLHYLINRSGLVISKGYQDISKSSENIFVCKLNDLYGVINSKDEIVIPFSYTKIGNFKNGYAYYIRNSKYGLLDIKNTPKKAQWDWISDVDTNLCAIVKHDNLFGLINLNDEQLLPTNYDYISHCSKGVYLIVKNGLYGFYNAKEKCFATSIDYTYNKALKPDYYSNGTLFKLIKENEVAIVDANGRFSINFGTYGDINFAKCDIIRIMKNNKFGFVDKRLKPITQTEYETASDYKNDLAIVTKNNTTSLIDKTGKSVYSIKNGEIEPFDEHYYLVKQNDLIGLINLKATIVLPIEFDTISPVSENLFRCEKNKQLFVFNSLTKQIIPVTN